MRIAGGLALVAALWLAAGAAEADRLHLTGRLVDRQGMPLARESFRLVLGSDSDARAAGAGRRLVTDAQGRFEVDADVTLTPRRIKTGLLTWVNTQLLEIGMEFDLIGQPALYWVELDYTRAGPARGIAAFVADAGGRFAVPLTFHDREFSWSIPGDPRGLRLTDIGADLRVEDYNDGEGGVWRLDVTVIRARFEMR